jgi:hypothetical protein
VAQEKLSEKYGQGLKIKMRTKYYLILICISLILLFYSLWQIKPVIVDINDFLGLTSHLTPFYWVGLALILACSVIAYLDARLKNDAVFIIILLTLGLFLFGPRIFAEANPFCAAPYWFGARFKDAMGHQPIDPSSSLALENYSAWPGYHFITANLLSLTGAGYEPLMKYMPLFWLVSCAFITFAAGKQLGFTRNNCFLLAVFTIASFWLAGQNCYVPQMLAFIEYLLIFMLVITYTSTLRTILLTIITYLGLVITHGLTPVAVILGTLAVSIYLRKNRFVLVFTIVFIGWIIFIAPFVFKTGLTQFWDQLVNRDFFTFLGSAGYGAAPTIAGQIGKLSRIFYPVVYALLMAIAVIMYLTKKVEGENRNKIALCFAWIAGIVLILPVGTAWRGETDWRVYIYLLLPVAAVAVLVFSGRLRILLAGLMVLFVILHIPASYHTEAEQQTLTTELRGAEFFAVHVHSNEPTYITRGYMGEIYIQYYDPAKWDYPWRTIEREDSSKDRVQAATALILEQCKFILTGDRTHNIFMYTYDFDPVDEWLIENPTNLIYDNGHYQIFRR